MKTLLTMTVTADEDNPEQMQAMLKMSEAFYEAFLSTGNFLTTVPIFENSTDPS